MKYSFDLWSILLFDAENRAQVKRHQIKKHFTNNDRLNFNFVCSLSFVHKVPPVTTGLAETATSACNLLFKEQYSTLWPLHSETHRLPKIVVHFHFHRQPKCSRPTDNLSKNYHRQEEQMLSQQLSHSKLITNNSMSLWTGATVSLPLNQGTMCEQASVKKTMGRNKQKRLT